MSTSVSQPYVAPHKRLDPSQQAEDATAPPPPDGQIKTRRYTPHPAQIAQRESLDDHFTRYSYLIAAPASSDNAASLCTLLANVCQFCLEDNDTMICLSGCYPSIVAGVNLIFNLRSGLVGDDEATTATAMETSLVVSARLLLVQQVNGGGPLKPCIHGLGATGIHSLDSKTPKARAQYEKRKRSYEGEAGQAKLRARKQHMTEYKKQKRKQPKTPDSCESICTK